MRAMIRIEQRSRMRTWPTWIPAVALVLLPVILGMASAQQPAATPAQAPSAASPSPPATTTAPTASDQAAPAAAAPAAEPDAAASPTPQSDATPAAAKPVGAPAATGKGGKPLKPKHPPKPKKVKPPPMVPVTIQRGVLTVDGWTGKADLNYTIMDLKYIYLWAPGIGTAVVSSDPFPGAQIQGNAIDGHTLTVNVEGHTLQLTSDHDLLSGKELVKAAYVLLDTAYVPDNPQYPQFGYGTSSKAPYAWPASLANYTGDVSRAPPLPKSLLPPLKTQTTCATKPDGTKGDCTAAPVVMYPVKESKNSEKDLEKEKKKAAMEEAKKEKKAAAAPVTTPATTPATSPNQPQ